MVAIEVDAFDEGERRVRPLDFGHRDRAVQRHDRARGEGDELVVELQDLPPVCGRCVWSIAVDGVYRGLELVRTRLVAPKAAPDDVVAFGYEGAIPEVAILIGQPHELAGLVVACAPA